MKINELIDKNYITKEQVDWIKNLNTNEDYSVQEHYLYRIIYSKNTTLIVLNNLKDFFYVLNQNSLRTKYFNDMIVIDIPSELIVLKITLDKIVELNGCYC